jgi:hypothetical protein
MRDHGCASAGGVKAQLVSRPVARRRLPLPGGAVAVVGRARPWPQLARGGRAATYPLGAGGGGGGGAELGPRDRGNLGAGRQRWSSIRRRGPSTGLAALQQRRLQRLRRRRGPQTANFTPARVTTEVPGAAWPAVRRGRPSAASEASERVRGGHGRQEAQIGRRHSRNRRAAGGGEALREGSRRGQRRGRHPARLHRPALRRPRAARNRVAPGDQACPSPSKRPSPLEEIRALKAVPVEGESTEVEPLPPSTSRTRLSIKRYRSRGEPQASARSRLALEPRSSRPSPRCAGHRGR